MRGCGDGVGGGGAFACSTWHGGWAGLSDCANGMAPPPARARRTLKNSDSRARASFMFIFLLMSAWPRFTTPTQPWRRRRLRPDSTSLRGAGRAEGHHTSAACAPACSAACICCQCVPCCSCSCSCCRSCCSCSSCCPATSAAAAAPACPSAAPALCPSSGPLPPPRRPPSPPAVPPPSLPPPPPPAVRALVHDVYLGEHADGALPQGVHVLCQPQRVRGREVRVGGGHRQDDGVVALYVLLAHVLQVLHDGLRLALDRDLGQACGDGGWGGVG